jgi:hypothetical protein
MNSALDPQPLFGREFAELVKARASAQEKLKKAAEQAFNPVTKAASIGSLLLAKSPGLSGGRMRKLADLEPYETHPTSDHRDADCINKAVSAALARLRPNHGHPSMAGWISKAAMPAAGPGDRVRALKKANDSGANSPFLSGIDREAPAAYDRNLPGAQGVKISEAVLEVINTLPDGRARNQTLTTLLIRNPLTNINESYKWRQSVVELIGKIEAMIGAEAAKPLTECLKEKVGIEGEISYFDVNTQSAPPVHHAPGTNLGPSATNPTAWPSELRPPSAPVDPGQFSNSGGNSDYMSPDFKLAKFYRAARRGVDLRKDSAAAGDDADWWKSSERLLQYADVMVKASFAEPGKSMILKLANLKKSMSPDKYRRQVMADSTYKKAIQTIMQNPELTEAMRGSILALCA